MYQNLKGLIIRSVDYRDADKILTVFTDTLGKITVKARGARRKGSKTGVASQLFVYSDMTLFERQGRYTMNEAQPREVFAGLQNRLENVALASYLAELLATEGEADAPHPDVLRLALNGLYALSKALYPAEQVKAAFELRYMALSGYHPVLEVCSDCGETSSQGWFLPATGQLACDGCNRGEEGLPLDAGALAAARYILTAPVSRVYSFAVGEASRPLLYRMCEEYLLHCMERDFKTLGFFRSLSAFIPQSG